MQQCGKNIELYAVFPWHSAVVSATIGVDTMIHPLLGFREDTSSGVVWCMLSHILPSSDTWNTTYDNDTETRYMCKL